MSTPRPVFLLSLPRSGSTLLQRMLMTHPAISSKPEPWLLLPIFYARREAGHKAEYWEYTAQTAINEFVDSLPGGENDFYAAVNRFATELYAKAAADNARYFVDKTPRYHLVVEELMRTFPDARFIYLWRNPLAIIASIINTWGHGKWDLQRFDIDLFRGLRNLMDGFRAYGDRSIAVNFEALLASPTETLQALWAYLDLEDNDNAGEHFSSVDVAGAMGDPTGVADYDAVTTEPVDKWQASLNNPLRKAWCRAYLQCFSSQDWAAIGYQRDELLANLDAAPSGGRYLFSDTWRMLPGWPGSRRFQSGR